MEAGLTLVRIFASEVILVASTAIRAFVYFRSYAVIIINAIFFLVIMLLNMDFHAVSQFLSE